MVSRVIVEVNPLNGTFTVEVEGAEGTKCTDITNALTNGKKVLNQELKNEYYESSPLPDYAENF